MAETIQALRNTRQHVRGEVIQRLTQENMLLVRRLAIVESTLTAECPTASSKSRSLLSTFQVLDE